MEEEPEKKRQRVSETPSTSQSPPLPQVEEGEEQQSPQEESDEEAEILQQLQPSQPQQLQQHQQPLLHPPPLPSVRQQPSTSRRPSLLQQALDQLSTSRTRPSLQLQGIRDDPSPLQRSPTPPPHLVMGQPSTSRLPSLHQMLEQLSTSLTQTSLQQQGIVDDPSSFQQPQSPPPHHNMEQPSTSLQSSLIPQILQQPSSPQESFLQQQYVMGQPSTSRPSFLQQQQQHMMGQPSTSRPFLQQQQRIIGQPSTSRQSPPQQQQQQHMMGQLSTSRQSFIQQQQHIIGQPSSSQPQSLPQSAWNPTFPEVEEQSSGQGREHEGMNQEVVQEEEESETEEEVEEDEEEEEEDDHEDEDSQDKDADNFRRYVEFLQGKDQDYASRQHYQTMRRIRYYYGLIMSILRRIEASLKNRAYSFSQQITDFREIFPLFSSVAYQLSQYGPTIIKTRLWASERRMIDQKRITRRRMHARAHMLRLCRLRDIYQNQPMDGTSPPQN